MKERTTQEREIIARVDDMAWLESVSSPNEYRSPSVRFLRQLVCELRDTSSDRGHVIRVDRYVRADARANPGTTYVFGDNLLGIGLGGQAAELRGEPNALGIPTKREPSSRPGAFFTDADFDEVRPRIDAALAVLHARLNAGLDVVLPAAGVGTGLADLPRRAPSIHRYVEARLRELG